MCTDKDFLTDTEREKIRALLRAAVGLHATVSDVVVADIGTSYGTEVAVYAPAGPGNRTLLHFRLIPTNMGLLQSVGLYISPELRGKGLSNTAQAVKEYIAKGQGWKGLICTVRKDNVVEQRCLDRYGWKRVAEFGAVDLAVRLFRGDM